MADVVAHFVVDGAPLVSPTTVPTVTIWRNDTAAVVVNAATMTEVGGGSFRYTFAPTFGLLYSVRVDGDPGGLGQTAPHERYQFASLSGIPEELLDLFLNRAVTTVLGDGSKRLDFYADDGTTIVATINISADGLERTP